MVRRKSSEVIVEDHLRRIAAGDLKAGDPLPTENELARRYDMGRTVVREALQTLSAKGFVTVRQGSGSAISPRLRWNQMDPQYLHISHGGDLFADLMEAREILEPAIAVLAAQRAGTAELGQLSRLADELADLGSADASRHAELDMAFHEALVQASRNPVLISMHDCIAGLGWQTRIASVAVPGAVDRAVFWHRQVLAAVQERDAEGARHAMALHMRQVRVELLRAELSQVHESPTGSNGDNHDAL